MSTKGASAGNTRAKNQAMAARMKAEGIKRNTARCPICHNLIGLNHMENHVRTCGGSNKSKQRGR